MICVVGPGRCGTSTVARWFFELGVFMGYDFVPGNESNPSGHFEDVDFRNLNQRFLGGRITLPQWNDGFRFLVSQRNAAYHPWGFKDPRTADLIAHIAPWLGDGCVYIRVQRNLDEVVASMARWYNWTEDQAREIATRREANLNQHVPHASTIKFEDIVHGAAREQLECLISSPSK